MIALCAVLLGLLIGASYWAVTMHRAWRWSQRYAVRRSEELTILDPQGQAYSDMATVMVLALDGGGRRYLESTSGRPDHG